MASENKSGPESMEYLFTPHNLASLDFETPPACVQHWSSQVAQIITTMCKEAGDRADTTKKELEAQILAKEKIISDWKGIAEDRAKELALLHHTIKSREADVSRLKSQLAISQRNEDREKDENNRVVKAWKEEAELLTNKLRAKESLLNDIRNDYLRMKERADLEKREALDVDLAREIAGRMREVGEIYSRSKYLIEQVVKKESGCDEPNREDQVEDGTNERRQRKRRDEPRDPKSEQAAAPKKQRPCGVTRRHPKLPTRDGGNQNENSTRTSRWRPTYDNTPPIPGQAEPPRQSPEHAGPQDVNIKFEPREQAVRPSDIQMVSAHQPSSRLQANQQNSRGRHHVGPGQPNNLQGNLPLMPVEFGSVAAQEHLPQQRSHQTPSGNRSDLPERQQHLQSQHYRPSH